MKEAEKQLLQTLNGQLSELPSVAKIMIEQYQMSAIVLSVICGVIFIVLTGLLIWAIIRLIKERYNSYIDNEFLWLLVGLVGVPLDASLFIGLVVNVTHACAPIASLITSITN